MDFFLPIFIVYFSVCVPAFCSEWFHHLLEHFVVGNFPPLQILPLFCARPHQFLFMWFMGERKGASTSERNARNINSFINNTTKTFFFFNTCRRLQGGNKQTNNKKKNPLGFVLACVKEHSETAQTTWAGSCRVSLLHISTMGCPRPMPPW